MLQKIIDNMMPILLMALVSMAAYVWDFQGEYVHDKAEMTGKILALETALSTNGKLTDELASFIYQTITDVDVANNELKHLANYLQEQNDQIENLRERRCP